MSKADLISALTKVREIFDDLKTNSQKDQAKQLLGDIPYRVIHLNDNPADIETRAKESTLAAMKNENERLKARLWLLEADNQAEVTMRIDDALHSSNQIEVLTKRLDMLKGREERTLNSFKKVSREFREVCYLLFGYMINPMKNDVFKLSHMYAEREEDALFFVVKDKEGDLLGNEYTGRYSEYITRYLDHGNSFPAFLAMITMDLFKATTRPIDMSLTLVS